MSAKSTISAAKFEKENKKRFFYRKNLIKTKCKDWSIEIKDQILTI